MKQRHTAKRIWESVARGARLHGRLHDRQRLRARQDAGRAGDVRAARASAGRRPGRFRRSTGGHRGRRVQGALPRRGSPAQRRRVREGVSRRDDGGVLRRAQRRVRLLRRGAAAHSVYDNTKLAVARILGDGTRQRTQVFSELQVALLVSTIASGGRGKATTKAKWKGWSATPAATSSMPIPRCASWDVLNAD